MTFALVPLYLLGNLHCLGMCGPLMLLIARHRYKWLYLVGRLLSFSLAGLLATTLGLLLNLYCPGIVAIIIGCVLIGLGILKLSNIALPSFQFKPIAYLSSLLLKEHPFATLSFGFCTIFLPCGQTLTVYSALALLDHPLIGLFNGFLFALLTTPALVTALFAGSLFKRLKRFERPLIGMTTLVIGLLALLRAMANYEWINHLILPHDIALY